MPAKLYVGNISSSCSQSELNALFSKYGEVTELDIVKNFAFVHFEQESGAQKAVRELHDTDFKGSKLQVQFSKNQDINRGNKHILKNSDKNAHQHHNKESRPSQPTPKRLDPALRGRLPADRIPNPGGGLHRDYRAVGFAAAAGLTHRSKPYDRLPTHSPALPRYAAHPSVHPAALSYRPSARMAAYAEYYKAAALSPAALTSHLTPTHVAAASNPYAYYDRLLNYKDPRLAAAAPAANHAAAYAAYYSSAAAKDPYTTAQIAHERYAAATSRAAAFANAYSASALRGGAYPPY